MKKLVIALLALATSLAASDVSGIWSGKGGIQDAKYGSVPTTAQLTLLQAGATVTGTFKMDNGKIMPISTGSIDGNQIVFVVNVGTGQITARFAPIANRLVGRMTSSTGKVIDFVFTKQ
jgi:hypothetical protein